MTRLGKQYNIKVQLREYGRSVNHEYTFVFNPQVVRKSEQVGFVYKVDSVGDSWETAIKRAGSGIERHTSHDTLMRAGHYLPEQTQASLPARWAMQVPRWYSMYTEHG